MKLRLIFLILIFSLIGKAVFAAADYSDAMETALTAIESGNYLSACEPLNRLLTLNANNEETLILLGSVLLHSGHIESAKSAFTRAVELVPDSALGMYGLGLCRLSRKDFPNALNYLRKSLILAPDRPIESSVSYAEAVATGFKFKRKPGVSSDILDKAVDAFYFFKTGKLREAASLADQVLELASGYGENEHKGAVAWFASDKPLIFSVRDKLPSKLTAYDFEKLQKVSGTVQLKADTSRIARPAYVVFKLDGMTMAIINCEPYEYSWKTENTANGVHTICITSYDLSGKMIAGKEKRVFVINNKNVERTPSSSEMNPQVRERLWKIILLKPSIWPASYIKAKYALETKDISNAVSNLERCLALDPDRADSRSLLKKIYASSQRLGAIKNTNTRQMLIALTFDDGPADNTEKILNTLKEYGAKATFFIVGSRAIAKPSLVKRIAEEGHEIGNHTYSHRNMQLVSQREVESEVFKTNVVLRALTGRRAVLFRPPGGNINDSVGSRLADYGIRCVYWSFNCGTFENASAIKYREQLIKRAKRGAIFLMHNGEEVTAEALPDIIKALFEKGFKFVTVSELIEAEKRVFAMKEFEQP